ARSLFSQDKLEHNLRLANQQLNDRLQELNIIYTVGKSVNSTLNLDKILSQVVQTSVNLTQADEGFILLQEGEKLYLRAAQNLSENIVQRFHVEAADSIAWQVIKSGRPAALHRDTKIATGYLVRSLLYVPLQAPGRGTIGVLAVVNRQEGKKFNENQVFTLSALGDFAAIALENARLFSAVEAEKMRLTTILKYASEAVLVTDNETHLILWSQTAAKLFEIPPEAQGKPLDEYVKHPTVVEVFNQTPEDGPVVHTEVALENSLTFNAQLTFIEKIGRVMIMQDITHLKELDKLKSEFVSTVSHDLRTPLTTIQGYVELLDRVGPLNDTQQSFIEKALHSLAHITELISDLLDIGRIEAGYNLEMHPCRLDEIIAHTCRAYVPTIEQAELQLSWHLDNESPLYVRGNRRRLRQVIENLLSNAVKYSRRGGRVEVEANRDGQHIIVTVKDNGIGIPVDEQPKIFERFYRVQLPETEDIQGTGLGLAIVKSVIEKHKGRIWVESALGKGSKFTFVLPILDKEQLPEA
ncbi:MAG: GAF domain-containing protein, partial [Anaerolineae bacterium]|nr:GAF domain-containing protein [Anaerolineae bacterium]